jgi:hypothetical protein
MTDRRQKRVSLRANPLHRPHRHLVRLNTPPIHTSAVIATVIGLLTALPALC